MTKTNRPLVLTLLACTALLTASPAFAHENAAPASHEETSWVQSAVHWVASCLPGSGSTGSTGSKSEAGKTGSSWWTSGTTEGGEHGKSGEKGIVSSLTGWLTDSHKADDKTGHEASGGSKDDNSHYGSSGGASGSHDTERELDERLGAHDRTLRPLVS